MARHTLFAYVDGSAFSEAAEELELRFDRFVDQHQWRAVPTVVNQIHADDSAPPTDVPEWDLGLNLALPDPGEEPRGWFTEIERIVAFLADLHRTTGHGFVVGIHDSRTGVSEDLFSVDRPDPNIEELRSILGVQDGAR